MRSTSPGAEKEAHDRVRLLVLRAMKSLLPPQSPSASGAAMPLPSLVDRLVRATLAPDPAEITAVVRAMRRAGVSPQEIAEVYVPRTAQVLGLGWTCDEMDFRQVSVGSARLQALLRRLADDWAMAHPHRAGRCPSLLVAVPEGVQHTLGASVLAGQLRHRGLSVHLDLALSCDALAVALGNQRFMGIFLSASGMGNLELCRDLVAICRKYGQGTPVIVGGTILEHHNDIATATGCDLATSDPSEALRRCGLESVFADASARAEVQTLARAAE